MRSKRNTFNRHCKWRPLASSTRVSTLLMDQELRRLRSYEQDSGGENATDADGGCNYRPLLRPGLEPKSSLKPPVASACPFSWSVASVHVGRSVWDRHLAPLAQIERAEGRTSSGCVTDLILLDAAILCHLRPSGLHFLGWRARSRSSLEGQRCDTQSNRRGCVCRNHCRRPFTELQRRKPRRASHSAPEKC